MAQSKAVIEAVRRLRSEREVLARAVSFAGTARTRAIEAGEDLERARQRVTAAEAALAQVVDQEAGDIDAPEAAPAPT